MRVSTSQVQRQAVNAILDQQARLSTTQLQIATGRRIVSPSDDAAGAARIIDLEQGLAVNRQLTRNGQTATNRLNLEEDSLVAVNNVLQRVRELAIQANGGALTNDDRRSIASEVASRLDELLALANTRDANNEFLFSGFQTLTEPFAFAASGATVYRGDQGQRLLQIGASFQSAVSDSGSRVFLEVKNGNGVFTTLDGPDNAGSGVIDPGTVSDISAFDRDTYSVVFPVETAATPNLAFADPGSNDNLGYTLSINGTPVYSVDEAGVPIDTLDGLAAQINTGTPTTGVRAYVDHASGRLYLGNVPPSDHDIVVEEGVTGATPGDGDTLQTYFGASLNADTAPLGRQVYPILEPFDIAAGPTLGFSDAIGTNDDLSYTLSINGRDVYSVAESGVPVTTLDALAAEINDDTPLTRVRAVVDAGTLRLESDLPGSHEIVVSERIGGFTPGDGDQITGYLGATLQGDGVASSTVRYSVPETSAVFVEDSAGNVETGGAYVEGAPIAFNGIQTQVRGRPKASDRFTISPAANQDVFATVRHLVDALNIGVDDPTGRARLANSVNRFLVDIDQATDNIIGVRADVGARLNGVETEGQIIEDSTLFSEQTVSQVRDLDFAEASGRLNLQLLAFQAAQQAFVRIQNLSLFNFL